MNSDTPIATSREDRLPLKRADVEHSLQEVGSPNRLQLMRENLQGVDLSHFTLSEANLCNADLSETDLGEANLSGAILSGSGSFEKDSPV
jgi:uncharacterized protein YjbI with pentapeptide repeats